METLNKALSIKLFSLGEGQDVTVLQLLLTLLLIAIGLWIARSIEKKLSTTLTEHRVSQDMVRPHHSLMASNLWAKCCISVEIILIIRLKRC